MIILSFLFCISIFYGKAFAQTINPSIARTLSSYGLEKVKVSASGRAVRVEYVQQLSEFETLDQEAVRLAEITEIVNRHLLVEKEVHICQIFNDGQILLFTITPRDALALLKKQLSTAAFLARIQMKPLTRGFAIVPGTCDLKQGDNCENSEACICHPNEICSPTSPQANKRGCVVKTVPSNAHAVGSEYVCDEGYEWNLNLTDCIRKAEISSPPPVEKPKVSTTWGSLSTVSKSSIIAAIWLLDSIPPTVQGQKSTFSPGDTLYVWVESKVLNKPHKLQIIWVNPEGKEVKQETFGLKGWGTKEAAWSELQTNPQSMPGEWQIKLLLDGQIYRTLHPQIN